MITLLRTIFNKETGEEFNAKKAFSVAKYGKETTSAEVYERWLKEIEEEIKYLSQTRLYSCILNIPEDKEKYLEATILVLKDKGFNTNLISKNTLKDYTGQSKFLLITWDNVGLD